MIFLLAATILASFLAATFLVCTDATIVSEFLRQTDYWLSLAIWAAFVVAWKRSDAIRTHLQLLPLKPMVLFAALIGIFLINGKTGYRITNDELVIASTARSMHLERIGAPMANRFVIDGESFAQYGRPDKRPSAYPLLISFFHDVLGYDNANLFRANLLLSAVILFAATTLLYQASGRVHASILFLAVLIGSPAYTQIVFGGLIESTNLLAILGITVAVHLYLRKPGALHQDILIYSTVLAANARYESGLFVLVTGLLILRQWLNQKRLIYSSGVFIAPLLMIAPFAHVVLYTKIPYHWQLPDGLDAPFGLHFFTFNLGGIVRLFTNSGEIPLISSTFLPFVALGLVSFGACRIGNHHRTPDWSRPLGIITITILIGLLPTLFYFWGDLSNREASRIGIALIFLIVFVSARWFGTIRPIIPQEVVSAGALIYIWLVAIPGSKGSDEFYTADHPASVRFEEFILDNLGPEDLVISGLAGLLQESSSLSALDRSYDLRNLGVLKRLGIFESVILIRRPASYELPHHDLSPLGISETAFVGRSFSKKIFVSTSSLEFAQYPPDAQWIEQIPLPLNLDNRSSANLHILARLVQANFLGDDD